MSASITTRPNCSPSYDAVLLSGGCRKAPRPADPRARPCRRPFRHGVPAAAEPPRRRRNRRSTIIRSWPAASMSSSSAAATPAPTASARRSARVRCRCTQLEIMPQPPEKEDKPLTWPNWPLKLRTSSSHQEGAERDFSVVTQKFSGENGVVKKLHCVRVDAKMAADPRLRIRAQGRSGAAGDGLRASGARRACWPASA